VTAGRLEDGDGRFLLRHARRAIERTLGLPQAPDEPIPPATRSSSGAFVTLRGRRGGELRGCIGSIEPRAPLHEAVAEAAIAAALEDPRFPPVTRAELVDLRLDVSVLSPLAPIAPEAVEVGRHGLLVRHQGRGGLLLPQVATEQGWDRQTLLEQTCRKAGLPRDAWREPGCRLLGFEAQVFEEP
jgi:AmmeMemoRadiSam system protein A